MDGVWRGLAGAGLLAFGSSCGPSTFACTDESQCVDRDQQGICVDGGACIFPDADCPSGYSYGSLSPGSLPGMCYTPPEGTGGTSTGSSTSTSNEGSTGVLPATTTGPEVANSSSSGDGTTGSASTSTSSTSSSSSSDTTGSSGTEGVVERITDGIVVLYTFQGEGIIVPDVSGVLPPLDLLILFATETQWVDDGLQFNGPAGAFNGAADKIYEACIPSGELTIEAWVSPSPSAQEGPATLVRFGNADAANLALLHGDAAGPTDDYLARIRTPDSDDQGQPSLFAVDAAVPGPTHVMYVHAMDPGDPSVSNGTMWIDGVEASSQQRVSGFDPWNPTIGIAIGGLSNAALNWTGTMHLVAVYCRALTPAEVQTNFTAGY